MFSLYEELVIRNTFICYFSDSPWPWGKGGEWDGRSPIVCMLNDGVRESWAGGSRDYLAMATSHYFRIEGGEPGGGRGGLGECAVQRAP